MRVHRSRSGLIRLHKAAFTECNSKPAMKAQSVYALFFAFTAILKQGNLETPGGTQNSPYEAADVLKVFASFEYVEAISDSDNDTIFECMTSRRTAFDPEAQTATYVWTFPSTGEQVTFDAELGEIPGTAVITTPGDPERMLATIYYTDFKDCVVLDMDYRGHQCSLWTRREVKDAVPQHCIDPFVATCGVVVPPHSRDLCPDGEGDY